MNISWSDDNGARQVIDPVHLVYLGAGADWEGDGVPDLNAGLIGQGDDGDNLGGDYRVGPAIANEEDGTTFNSPIRAVRIASAQIVVGGGTGYLNAWMDFDGSGTLDVVGQSAYVDGVPVTSLNGVAPSAGAHPYLHRAFLD